MGRRVSTLDRPPPDDRLTRRALRQPTPTSVSSASSHGRGELVQEVVGPARHLLPRREHEPIAVTPRDAPFLVVVLVVTGVVVPAATVGLEDRLLRGKCEVEAVGTA